MVLPVIAFKLFDIVACVFTTLAYPTNSLDSKATYARKSSLIFLSSKDTGTCVIHFTVCIPVALSTLLASQKGSVIAGRLSPGSAVSHGI